MFVSGPSVQPAIVGGSLLRESLGFRSGEAFRLAARQGRIPVRLFKIPGRRGWFANEADVLAWQGRVTRQDEPSGLARPIAR
jgi:hypothetical protein